MNYCGVKSVSHKWISDKFVIGFVNSCRFVISNSKSEPVLSKQPVENISKLKASRGGFIGNLTDV